MQKKILFLHPGAKDISGVRNLLKVDERELGLEFVIDDNCPDYVFASEHIYYDEASIRRFFELQRNHPINIYFAGEAISADLNMFDYAIVFDKHLECEDRIGRIPLLRYFSLADEILTADKKYYYNEKNKFCCFMYSNANAHQRRDELFYALSRYKHVDSLGKHLNNAECNSDRYSADWKAGSIKIKAEYKFSIAAENAVYRGYTSEKIMTSFLAGSIPIYWGNPLVEEDFNKDAFINANGLTDDELLSKVRRIDEDNDLYNNMLRQPWLTNEQIERYRQDEEKYISFIKNIFDQSIAGAYRRGIGTAPLLYEKFVRRENGEIKKKGLLVKIFTKDK